MANMFRLIPLAIVALLLVPIAAHADVLTYSFKDIYTVHAAHVGDTIIVKNDDNVAHTIDGTDQSNEQVSSGVIEPGEQTQMEFVWPGEFSFYDKLHYNTTGVIFLVAPGEALPTNVYNHTSIADLYNKPVYDTTAQAPTVSTPTNETITNETSPTINNSGPSLSFEISNATSLSFQESNGTSLNATYWQGQAQYWQDQSNSWENKYNKLFAQIESALGI